MHRSAKAYASIGRGFCIGGGRRSGLRGVARSVPGLSCPRSKAEIAISNCNHAGDCNLHQARRGSGLEARRARRIQGDMGEMWGRYAESYGRDLIRWALGRWSTRPVLPPWLGRACGGVPLWACHGAHVYIYVYACAAAAHSSRPRGVGRSREMVTEIAGDGDGDRGRSRGDRGRWC